MSSQRSQQQRLQVKLPHRAAESRKPHLDNMRRICPRAPLVTLIFTVDHQFWDKSKLTNLCSVSSDEWRRDSSEVSYKTESNPQ